MIGYGKMGHMIEQVAIGRGHEIVSIIDIDNQGDFDSPAFRSADVAIEFTAPHVAYGNCQRAWEQGVKVVSGSTGWLTNHADDVRRACNDEGKTLFWASNFSLGVAIFSAVNRYLAQIMQDFPQYEVSMREVHHIHKLDAPSGTAITLACQIKDEAPRFTDVPIESVREGEVPGIHSIEYDSTADKIIITHDAHNRMGFALGAVMAAEFTASHQGLLSMDDMMTFGEKNNKT